MMVRQIVVLVFVIIIKNKILEFMLYIKKMVV